MDFHNQGAMNAIKMASNRYKKITYLQDMCSKESKEYFLFLIRQLLKKKLNHLQDIVDWMHSFPESSSIPFDFVFSSDLPEIVINSFLNYIDKTVYRTNSLLIISFLTSSCAPCIAEFFDENLLFGLMSILSSPLESDIVHSLTIISQLIIKNSDVSHILIKNNYHELLFNKLIHHSSFNIKALAIYSSTIIIPYVSSDSIVSEVFDHLFQILKDSHLNNQIMAARLSYSIFKYSHDFLHNAISCGFFEVIEDIIPNVTKAGEFFIEFTIKFIKLSSKIATDDELKRIIGTNIIPYFLFQKKMLFLELEDEEKYFLSNDTIILLLKTISYLIARNLPEVSFVLNQCEVFESVCNIINTSEYIFKDAASFVICEYIKTKHQPICETIVQNVLPSIIEIIPLVSEQKLIYILSSLVLLDEITPYYSSTISSLSSDIDMELLLTSENDEIRALSGRAFQSII